MDNSPIPAERSIPKRDGRSGGGKGGGINRLAENKVIAAQ